MAASAVALQWIIFNSHVSPSTLLSDRLRRRRRRRIMISLGLFFSHRRRRRR